MYARIMNYKSLVEIRMGQSIAESGLSLNDKDKQVLLDRVTFAVDSSFNEMISNLIKNQDDLVTKPKTRARKKK